MKCAWLGWTNARVNRRWGRGGERVSGGQGDAGGAGPPPSAVVRCEMGSSCEVKVSHFGIFDSVSPRLLVHLPKWRCRWDEGVAFLQFPRLQLLHGSL